MTYDEAIDETFTQAEARREIDLHDGSGFDQFIIDCGDHETYSGADILGWLGY